MRKTFWLVLTVLGTYGVVQVVAQQPPVMIYGVTETTGVPRPVTVDASGQLVISASISGVGDGAIEDGVDGGIEATVFDLTSSNPVAAQIVDGDGVAITSFGGGSQYEQDAALTVATTIGTIAMGRASAAAPTNVSAGNDAVMPWYSLAGAVMVNLTAAGALIAGDATNGLDVDVTRMAALVAGDADIGNVDLEIAGTAIAVNAGVNSAQTLRVTLATDDEANDFLATIAGDTTAIEVATESILTPIAAGSATATAGVLIGGQYNLTPPTFTDGQQGSLQMTSAGALIVSGGGGGTEYVVNAVAPANPTGNAPVAERDDALSALTEVEGDWTNLRTDANGALWVILSGTSAVSGTVTANLSATDNAVLDDIADGIAVTGTVTVTDGAGALNVIIDSSASLTVTDGAGALNTIVDSGTITTVSTVTTLSQLGGVALPIEDAAETAAGVGIYAMSVRRDTAASSAGTTGDNATINTDSLGRLWVTGSAVEDVAETAAGLLTMAGTVRRDTAASSAGTTGDNATLNTDAVGALWVNPFSQTPAATTYLSVRITDGSAYSALSSDATFDAAAITTGPQLMGVFDDASTDSVDEGDAGSLRISGNRNLFTTLRDAAGNERGANVNASNELLVNCGNCTGSGAAHTDDAAFTPATDDIAPAGFLFDDVAPDSVNEGDAGIGRMSANRNQYVTLRDAAGNERGLNIDASGQLAATIATFPDNEPFNLQQVAGTTATAGAGVVGAGSLRVTIATDDEVNDELQALTHAEDAAHSTGQLGVMLLAVRQDTQANLNADGDYNPLSTNNVGELRAVLGTSSAQIGNISALSGSNIAHDAADSGNPHKIGGYASTTPPTAVTAADRVSAWYTLNGAAVTVPGGATVHYRTSAGSTEDEHEIKATAGTLYSVLVTNTNAAARYLRCYNLTAANTTPGTSTVFWGAAIPGNTAGAGFVYPFPAGMTFDTALTCALTTGAADTDVAEVAANEIKITYSYR